MQKKIIFLVPNLFYGGASKVITLICNNLCNRRFKILLVAVNGENNFYTQDIAQLNFIDLKKKSIGSLKGKSPILFFQMGRT